MEQDKVILEQYKILNDRLWKYNDLLWKTFIAYGAVLSAISYLYYVHKADMITLGAIGGLILLTLGIIQISYVQGQTRTSECLSSVEKENRFLKNMTKPPSEITWGVTSSYWAASVGMVLIGIVLILYGILYTSCPCLYK